MWRKLHPSLSKRAKMHSCNYGVYRRNQLRDLLLTMGFRKGGYHIYGCSRGHHLSLSKSCLIPCDHALKLPATLVKTYDYSLCGDHSWVSSDVELFSTCNTCNFCECESIVACLFGREELVDVVSMVEVLTVQWVGAGADLKIV